MIGFDFMGSVIWQKQTTMNTSGGGSVMGSFPHPRNGIVKLDFEYILLFKKQGTAPKPTPEQKELSVMTKEEWNTYFAGHWHFGGAKQDAHLAMFPDELPKRLIKMFSFHNENVLDPFMGSGTTALVARGLGRNSCGYEINPDFIPIIKNKLGADKDNLFDDARFDFVTQENPNTDFNEKIKQLPYTFVDTHKLDKKIDVSALKFGSKINGNGDEQREEYFTVKEIISPELVVLSNGLTVRLIGIKQDMSKNGSATDFLSKKTKGQKVFLKYDAEKYDAENNLLVYLYLQNKTFLNAHLIKHGFALVDENADFKYKTKFNNF
jgi:site-specific DNA-methyltransferase (adenine-specific)